MIYGLHLAIYGPFRYNGLNYHERQGIAMEENNNDIIRSTPPRRRRKRTKWQDFKEAYLPVIIAALALILILVFIFGSIKRHKNPNAPVLPNSTESTISPSESLQLEADSLITQANVLASHFDYQAAMDLLKTYSAGVDTNETLKAKYDAYAESLSKLVPYTDVEKIPNLSFNLLIEDLPRALADETYGSKYNENYVTTKEFKAILQQLYDNNYILVSPYEIAPLSTGADGQTTITKGTLYLPEGKKPLVLTQHGVNYHTYMVDSDGDGLADKNGAGFASRLIVDANGKLMNEMVAADGSTVTGAFDLIPILDEFVNAHPDFSYKGAKAVIAVTGYDGLFGYRTDPETATVISQEFYDKEVAAVVPIINAVRQSGYDIACFTYDNVGYGDISSTDIQQDLSLWTKEVTPLLGNVDILVYPYGNDINEYSGNQYTVLEDFGFKYFIGQDNSTPAWGQITDSYARQSRRWVTGSEMAHNPNSFSDLFDASAVLDTAGRGEIPS